jgi:Sigma-70 region 2
MADEASLHRARSGDGAAFADIVEPYRRELHLHFFFYRMLGSFDDADDALQETLLAAWRGLASFQSRGPPRRGDGAGGPPGRGTQRRITSQLVGQRHADAASHAVDSLLAEDIRIAMPPLAAVWEGRERAAAFLAEVAFRLVPQARFIQTRASGQPALAVYTRHENIGVWRVGGLLVITLRGERTSALTRSNPTPCDRSA